MKTHITSFLLATLLGVAVTTELHAQGTTFTYQGRLNDGPGPANGSYDLRFIPFNASDGGNQAGPILTNRATAVSDGLFVVNLDFAEVSFLGTNYWLEIAVRTNGSGGFVTLSPRQPVTPVPQAMASATALTALSLAGVVENNFVRDGYYGTVGGGFANTNTGYLATIGGGQMNRVTHDFGTVSGGSENRVTQSYGTVAGGRGNLSIRDYASVGGGYGNTNDGNTATLAGGYENSVSGDYGTVGGGYRNSNRGYAGTVAGGQLNLAEGESATVSGGSQNIATNLYATVPGGFRNVAGGRYSFAAGRSAQALHPGTFVWADQRNSPFSSSAENQFCIRALGGVQLSGDTSVSFGATMSQKLNLWNTSFGIGIQTGAQYARTGGGFVWFQGGSHSDDSYDPGPGGFRLMTLDGNGLVVNGTFVSLSDRHAKAGFAAVDAREILAKVAALPIARWHYTNAPTTTHLGPVAQDFHAAFHVGLDDKSIATVDADGVALAAIQGLNQKVDDEVKRRDAENAGLKRELGELQQLVTSLKQQLNGAKQ